MSAAGVAAADGAVSARPEPRVGSAECDRRAAGLALRLPVGLRPNGERGGEPVGDSEPSAEAECIGAAKRKSVPRAKLCAPMRVGVRERSCAA